MTAPRPRIQQPQAFVFLWDAVEVAMRYARAQGRVLFVNPHVHGWLIENQAFRQFGEPVLVQPNGQVVDQRHQEKSDRRAA